MKLYDLTLSVQSPLGTILAADTLFGHLCWGIRYRDGVAALEQFLASFDKPEPALLLSDPFPAGFWPIPVLPKPTPEQQDRLFELLTEQVRHGLKEKLPQCPLSEKVAPSSPVSDVEAFDILKWLNKLRWLQTDAFGRLVSRMSKANVLEYFVVNGCGSPMMPVEAVVAHNSINRLSNMTLAEGGLFFTKDYFVSAGVDFHLLVASDVYPEDQIIALFENALSGGYGRDKSAGKGKIVVGSAMPYELPKLKDPNAVMLLGPCMPRSIDPADGYWQIFTRFGKLGGDWATGPGPTGNHNPFKRPLTMLKAGSVLFTDAPQQWYGRLAEDVHPEFKEVRHYGISLAMPMHCDLEGMRI